MCTDITHKVDVAGTGYAHGEWITLRSAVVSFDHPSELATDHALCIDFRAGNGDPAARVAVELDRSSARDLVDAVLAALDER